MLTGVRKDKALQLISQQKPVKAPGPLPEAIKQSVRVLPCQ